MKPQVKFHSLGESSLTIDFGNLISIEINEKVTALAEYFDRENLIGIREVFPAYSSLTLFYDIIAIRKNYPHFPNAYQAVKNLAQIALDNLRPKENLRSTIIEIPVVFDSDSALDLEFVANSNNLCAERVIEIFTGKTYRVFMLGFLPGFAYLGEVDERIAVPRKDAPRQNVPRGSVGIAGRQTGIYPQASPGGWQIIGRTDFELYKPQQYPPTVLRAGDYVRFYKV